MDDAQRVASMAGGKRRVDGVRRKWMALSRKHAVRSAACDCTLHNADSAAMVPGGNEQRAEAPLEQQVNQRRSQADLLLVQQVNERRSQVRPRPARASERGCVGRGLSSTRREGPVGFAGSLRGRQRTGRADRPDRR